jgi:hypothetical protein
VSMARVRLWFCFTTLVFGLTSLAAGQGAPANTDIVKMIQAGLPESTVVNKIREGAGHWDTSVDALIALKQAGATEAELSALTTAPIEEVPRAQKVPRPPVEALGGQLLHTRDGDPYLQFSSSRPIIFPNGLESNAAYLVLYKGEIGVLIPGFRSDSYEVFNAIFLKDSLIVNNYLFEVCCENAISSLSGIETFSKADVSMQMDKKFSRWGNNQGVLTGGNLYTEMRSGTGKSKDVRPVLFGIFPFMEVDYTAERAAMMDPFVHELMSNFDKTIAEFERASGITEPTSQLSPAAHYEQITTEQAERYKVILLQRMREIKANDRSNGWLNALNAMQGVANMHQAYQDAKVADLSHNAAGQLRAATNATTAEMQTIGAVAGNATTIQPLAPAPSVPVQPSPRAAAAPKATGFTYNTSHGQNTAATPATKTVAFNTQPKAIPNLSGVPSGVSTGTAAPANCVAVNVEGPCVPLSEYQQAQQQATGQGICPASGFVPGVMLRQTSDVAVGVPCKPGTPYGPLIATTASGGYTGVTPPGSASTGPSGSGSGGSAMGPFDPDLNNCVVYFYKNDPITGDHLILQNNCSVRAQVFFYASSQVYGGAAIDPGATDNTYAGHDKILAAGALSIYACPVNDIPRKPDGTLAYNGLNNRFLCSQK